MRRLSLILLVASMASAAPYRANPWRALRNLLGMLYPQSLPFPGPGSTPLSAPSAPSYVSVCSDFSGGGTVSCSVTAGNHLVIWHYANDRTAGHTCSNNGTANTYVEDGSITATGTANLIGNIAHVKTLAATATITITCTGTTPAIAAIQYSGGTGDLDTASAGSNPSTAAMQNPGLNGPISPAAFTPTTAATILVDGYADLTGGTITLSQTDTNHTTRASALNGGSTFVGGIGTRVVASSASYTNGWTSTSTDYTVAIHAIYK